MFVSKCCVKTCLLLIGWYFLISPVGFAEQVELTEQEEVVETVSEESKSHTSSLVIDYPELVLSVPLLTSVEVVWSHEMTYCSLITKVNLQRFTWLPATTTFGDAQKILQGDAIRLIEWWLASNSFVPLDDLVVDMEAYFPERDAYTLFDLYIYTPHPDEEVSAQEYLFQWHRVVLLWVHDTWWVMDPLRGNTASRQSWDIYKQYIDPTAYLFVYHEQYAFADWYALDFSVDETTKSNRDVEDLTSLVYKGIIVSELDATFMPLASTFLSNVTLLKEYVKVFFPAGAIIKSTDGSPFNMWLLTTHLYRNEKKEIIMKITLSGKKLLFSSPVEVTFSLDVAFPEQKWTKYVVKMAWAWHDWCIDAFDKKGASVIIAQDDSLTFPICRTGEYSVTPLLENASAE